jgi:hypothetical protein
MSQDPIRYDRLDRTSRSTARAIALGMRVGPLALSTIVLVLAACGARATDEASGAKPESDVPSNGAQPNDDPRKGDPSPDASAPDAKENEGDVPSASCGAFPAASDLAAFGTFGSTSAAEGPSCTIFRPKTLGAGNVRHPVIVWGNGTTAVVSLYKPAFELWASHGFIVAAANATNGQGSGKPLLDCLDWVLAQNTTKGSAYEGKVCARAGASGHSQGGGGALMAGRDPRVVVTAPLQPYIQQGYGGFDQSSIAKQTGAMLLLSGEKDDNATPSVHQKPVYDGTNVSVLWATLLGGDHYSPAIGGVQTYREVILAWFRLHLMGDAAQATLFQGPSCGLCKDTKWSVVAKGL